jgi:hypothetical protein
MEKSQKIIEAEANLQVAKMMDAVKRLQLATLDFGRISYDLKSFDKVVATVREAIDAVEMFNHHCSGGDLKLVTDIVDGIISKSKYEQQIRDLKARLVAAENVYKETASANQRLRETAIKLVDTKDKEEVKNLLKIAKDYRFDTVIEKLMIISNPKCNVDEMPF